MVGSITAYLKDSESTPFILIESQKRQGAPQLHKATERQRATTVDVVYTFNR